jgi:hypothetical protein
MFISDACTPVIKLMLPLVFNIKPAKASGTIYLRTEGSEDSIQQTLPVLIG